MFRFKATSYIIHAAAWLLFFILPLLFFNGGQSGSIAWGLIGSSCYWFFCITYLVLFYLNTGFLIPRFFLRKKYVDYSIALVVLLSCVYYLQPFDKLLGHNSTMQPPMDFGSGPPPQFNGTHQPHNGMPPPFGPPPGEGMQHPGNDHRPPQGGPLWSHSSNFDAVSLVLFFIVTALGLSVRTVQQWQATEQKIIAAEAEKVNAELSFLKAQINPHFLFNTLNNIYTLSVMNSAHTSESIMKLSNIMRYVTDEVSANWVPLKNDIDCIRDFIDLQRLRLGRKTEVEFTVTGQIEHQQIAPLILMSFVENAFKYGISKQEQSAIKINVDVDVNRILFSCENRIFDKRPVLTERTGIGIANTRQRLQHLYPGRHELHITQDNQQFKVKLLLHT